MAKVYARVDSEGRVIGISSDMFVDALEGWVLIDEGDGDRYTLAQGNYLDGPLMTADGILRYKLVNGAVVERTLEEIAGDVSPEEPVEGLTGRLNAMQEMVNRHEEDLTALLGGEEDA